MRYFTRGLVNGEVSDDDERLVREAYNRRVEELLPRLSDSMRTLAVGVYLHDAVIEKVLWRPTAKELTVTFLTITSGSSGSRAVCVTYRGAMIGEQRVEVWESVAQDRRAEVLEHEVDIAPEGHFIHRLLFGPRDEVTVDFEELLVDISERTDRRVQLGGAFVIQRDDEREHAEIGTEGQGGSQP